MREREKKLKQKLDNEIKRRKRASFVEEPEAKVLEDTQQPRSLTLNLELYFESAELHVTAVSFLTVLVSLLMISKLKIINLKSAQSAYFLTENPSTIILKCISTSFSSFFSTSVS